MQASEKKFTLAVAAISLFLGLFGGSGPAGAQSAELDRLFEELQQSGEGDWQAVENRIWNAWSHSGSDAMDLLLERGRAAMQAGELDKAIEHLTALTDNAPDFAEGWNARATAYFMLGEYGQSIADIERVLALNPRHFGALAGLGMIYERLDMDEAALRAYRAAIAVHPFRPDLKEAIERLEARTGGTAL